jgi:PKD repeat protein
MQSLLNHIVGFLRKLTFALGLLILALGVNAQTYDYHYTDGQIYFKFKDNIQPNIEVNTDRTVNMDQPAAAFLNNIRQSYNIIGLQRPFDLNNDPKLLRTFRLDFATPSDIEEIMAQLDQNIDLEYVEKVPLDRIEYVPNDTLYNIPAASGNLKWHLDRIQAEQAWDITRGSSAIKVAIVDNAIWSDHPDLQNKIVLERDVAYNTNNSNPPSTGDPFEWSHGTHCAGLSAAESDNTIGVASIGFNTSIIAVKAASNSDPSNISYGFTGVQWAANNGADVISMSWGNSSYSTTAQNMMNTVHNMGIILVGAAGNDGVSSAHYPSAYNHVISVASTNYDDQKSDFSNYGTTVDVCAPGGYGPSGQYGLLSTTYSTGDFGNYDLMAGTSMACPMVSGLCGLILSMNPNLDPDEVESILKTTADTIEYINPDYIGQLGAGRVNAFKAISNTPYPPIANFTTPLATITPGTSINFYDLSMGIPSGWNWSFIGGTPSSSNQHNPTNITYNTEGVYNVALLASNTFGSNTLTRTGYITVTNTPKPVVHFAASDSAACIGESIQFTDYSYYSPTSWEWSFNPNTIVYLEGTTGQSQNPVVSFSSPGSYTVTLISTNSNGSATMIKQNYMQISGSAIPLDETFESGAPGSFALADTIKSKVTIDNRAANSSLFGLHFQGSVLPTGWSGGGTSTTPDQAWNTNTAFHSEASICGIDASDIENIILRLDLRQTYTLGPKQCWFRVLINGVQVPDIFGVTDFNPTTASSDDFVTKYFDLSAYSGGVFSVKLQASARFADKLQGEGDNVFVDNISVYNNTGLHQTLFADGFGIYPNPSSGLVTIQIPGSSSPSELSILTAQGQTIYRTSVRNKINSIHKADLSHVQKGLYMVILKSGDQILTRKLILR